jgi:hypothetical protein
LPAGVDVMRSREIRYKPDREMDDEKLISSTRQWVNSVVVGLNLCPFAKRELRLDRVRFAVTGARTEAELLSALVDEFETLGLDSSIETTLLIHPQVLQDFYDYNEFLSLADGLLAQLRLDGVYQIASFHPDYQFSGTEPYDAENYSNRSPWPMLHILREESVEKAVAANADVEQIPARNIATLEDIGNEELELLLRNCRDC